MNFEDVAARYPGPKAGVKARIRYLGLDPENLSEDDLLKLDALTDHLNQKRSLESFTYAPTATVEVMQPSTEITRSTPIDGALEPIIDMPMDLARLEQIYAFLQRAADSEWHLPTSVVRSITGATPRGRIWKRFGFEFTPATRHGGENAWAVSQAAWDFPVG